MNPIDIVLVVLLVGIVALALRHLWKNKKSGKCSCGCDASSCSCGCCGNGETCQSKAEKK